MEFCGGGSLADVVQVFFPLIFSFFKNRKEKRNKLNPLSFL